MATPRDKPAPQDERDLLFAVLAHHADLITKTQFVEGCVLQATTRKDTPLPDVLVSQGWLKPEQKALVQQLLDDKLKRNRGDVRHSLDEALRNDPALQEEVELLSGQGPRGPTVPPMSTDLEPEQVRQRYQHLMAAPFQGGIGQVWKVRDKQLRRVVALKELRSEVARNPRAQQSFLEEASLTARLHHPNIVPVYDLFVPAEKDKSFYTMPFFEGHTLADAVRGYHENLAKGAAGPSQLRELLAAFVAVCRAVEYAHKQGVVHRDLKGHNVMLGGPGEVLVVDWGAAQTLGRGDGTGPHPPATPGFTPDQPAQMGGKKGTPGYMAPEQAAGRIDLIDARTDVYGLGAVLYEVLTARPPFDLSAEETRKVLGTAKLPPAFTAEQLSRIGGELLLKVEQEPVTPPGQVCPGTPGALEAVCLKALSKNRDARYPSAGALAEEVRSWLADEPVSVHRDPVSVRLSRLVRRHRTLTGAVGVVVLTVMIGLGVGLWAVEGERSLTAGERDQKIKALDQSVVAQRRTGEALGEVKKTLAREEAERRRSQTLVVLAMATFDDLLAPVGFAGSREIHGRPPSAKILEEGLRFYEQLLADAKADPGRRLEHGLALSRSADIYRLLRKDTQAQKLYEQAVEVQRPAAEEFNEPAHRRELSRTLNNLGRLLFSRKKIEEAERVLVKSERLRSDLTREVPPFPADQLALAHTLQNLAEVWDARHRPETEATYARAVHLLTELVKAHPRDLTYRLELAELFFTLGEWNYRGELATKEKALDYYRQAIALADGLGAEAPEVEAYREAQATGHSIMAGLLADLGRYRDAWETYLLQHRLVEKLERDFPENPSYKKTLSQAYRQFSGLAGVWFQHAEKLKLGKKWEGAEKENREIAKHLEQLREQFPEEARVDLDLTNVTFSLGEMLNGLGRYERAKTVLDQAGGYLKRLKGEPSMAPEYANLTGYLHAHRCAALRGMAAQARDMVADLMPEEKQFSKAQALFAQCKAGFQSYSQEFPQEPVYRLELVELALDQGDLFSNKGEWGRSEECYREAWETLKKAVRGVATQASHQKVYRKVHGSLYNLALLRFNAGGDRLRGKEKIKEGVAELDGCLRLMEYVAAEFPEIWNYKQQLMKAYYQVGLSYQTAGLAKEARQQFLRSAALLKQQLKLDFGSTNYYQGELGITHYHLASSLWQEGKASEARPVFEEAVKWQIAALKAQPHNPTSQKNLLIYYERLSRTLADAQDHEALADAAKHWPGTLPANPEIYKVVGFGLARAVPLVAKDARLSGDQKKELTESYSRKAVESLRLWFNQVQPVPVQKVDPSQLQHADLNPIREHPAFQRLVADGK